ncbi:hypothetical protein [Flavobacterium chungbukense]|uniref:hypothetical protein n=1 Tax=Flavobacterium chungbukense TaxID=877464 RepID=UPI0039EFBA3C
MKKILTLFLILSLTSSCITNYYYVNLEEDTPIYENKREGTISYYFIPKSEKVYVSSTTKKYKRIKWKKYKGWAINPTYSSSSSSSTTSNYTNSQSYRSVQNSYKPKSYSNGTVQVKGYYRKDGTYVRPHTRSAPKRR